MDIALHPGRVWDLSPIEHGEPSRRVRTSHTSGRVTPKQRDTRPSGDTAAPLRRERFAWLRDRTAAPAHSPVVVPDGHAPGSMYRVVDQIGARRLWERGITGSGVNVAVIDTGVADVPALSAPGKVIAVADLSDEAADPSTAYVDTYGHGTAMAGIIAGAEPGADPATSAAHPEKFLGVAPDAGIVSVKISGRDGSSNPLAVAAGIDWVIANAEALAIRVINLSYDSASSLGYRIDPLTAAVERAWQAGIVVVTIAGNRGNDSDRLASPGIDPYAITVASADVSEDGITIGDWSNSGDGVRNPDIAAPGGHIESLRAPGSDADLLHSDVGDVDRDPALFKGTGTSQSAAVVAGVAALLIEQNPDITPDQVKAAIMGTGTEIDGGDTDAGADLVQADLAAGATLTDQVQTWEPAVAGSAYDVSSVTASLTDSWGGSSWGGSSWGGSSWGGSSWGGSSWGGSSWGGSSWGGSSWGGSSWGGSSWGGSSWGGSSWGGSSWGGSSWGGSSWGGSSWGGSSWGGSSWGGSSWGGSSWGGSSWGGSSWGGSSWGGSSWGGSSWGGSSWGGSSWGGSSWGGSSWGGSSWGGSSWGGSSWGGSSWGGSSWGGSSWG